MHRFQLCRYEVSFVRISRISLQRNKIFILHAIPVSKFRNMIIHFWRSQWGKDTKDGAHIQNRCYEFWFSDASTKWHVNKIDPLKNVIRSVGLVKMWAFPYGIIAYEAYLQQCREHVALSANSITIPKIMQRWLIIILYVVWWREECY